MAAAAEFTLFTGTVPTAVEQQQHLEQRLASIERRLEKIESIHSISRPEYDAETTSFKANVKIPPPFHLELLEQSFLGEEAVNKFIAEYPPEKRQVYWTHMFQLILRLPTMDILKTVLDLLENKPCSDSFLFATVMLATTHSKDERAIFAERLPHVYEILAKKGLLRWSPRHLHDAIKKAEHYEFTEVVRVLRTFAEQAQENTNGQEAETPLTGTGTTRQ